MIGLRSIWRRKSASIRSQNCRSAAPGVGGGRVGGDRTVPSIAPSCGGAVGFAEGGGAGRQDTIDVGCGHAVVGHGAHRAVRVLDHQDTARAEGLQEGGPARQPAAHAKDDEVGEDAARVQRSGGRLGQTTGGFDAGHRGQPFGQAAGVGVVLGQACDGAVRAVAQGDQPGRGQDADLAHAAADELAAAAGAGDEVAAAHHHRSDRAGQPLRQAEGDRVGRVRPASIGFTPRATAASKKRAPSTWSGTPCWWAMAATDRT